MWMLLLSALAFGGELEIELKRAAIVLLDGASLEFPEGRMQVKAKGLEAGRHHLEVRGIGGRRITELELKIAHDERVTVRYAGKLLVVTDRSLELPTEEAPPPEPKPVQAETTLAELDDPALPAEPKAPQEASTVKVGSFQLIAPASAKVQFAQAPLRFSTASESFTATEIVPGSYPVTVEHEGRVVSSSEYPVFPGKNQKCLLSGDRLTCELVAPQLGLPQVSSEAVTTSVSTLMERTNPDRFEGPVSVTLKPSDPLDLSSVFLDGALLYKVRKGTSSYTGPIERGPHVLEVRGFDGTVWLRGKLEVGGVAPLELTFSPSGELQSNRDASVWTSTL